MKARLFSPSVLKKELEKTFSLFFMAVLELALSLPFFERRKKIVGLPPPDKDHPLILGADDYWYPYTKTTETYLLDDDSFITTRYCLHPNDENYFSTTSEQISWILFCLRLNLSPDYIAHLVPTKINMLEDDEYIYLPIDIPAHLGNKLPTVAKIYTVTGKYRCSILKEILALFASLLVQKGYLSSEENIFYKEIEDDLIHVYARFDDLTDKEGKPLYYFKYFYETIHITLEKLLTRLENKNVIVSPSDAKISQWALERVKFPPGSLVIYSSTLSSHPKGPDLIASSSELKGNPTFGLSSKELNLFQASANLTSFYYPTSFPWRDYFSSPGEFPHNNLFFAFRINYNNIYIRRKLSKKIFYHNGTFITIHPDYITVDSNKPNYVDFIAIDNKINKIQEKSSEQSVILSNYEEFYFPNYTEFTNEKIRQIISHGGIYYYFDLDRPRKKHCFTVKRNGRKIYTREKILEMIFSETGGK